MRRSFGLLLVVSMVGCSGGAPLGPRSPQVGDLIELSERFTRLYLDEDTFKTDAELASAGSDKRNRDVLADKFFELCQTSKVRILSATPMGYKVVVEDANGFISLTPPLDASKMEPEPGLNGKIGWIIAKELKAAPSSGTPK